MNKKSVWVTVILFVLVMFGVSPAIGKMVTLVPELVENSQGELIPDPDYWHVNGDVEFDCDLDFSVEEMRINGANNSSDDFPFNSAGLFLKRAERDISYLSGSIMIPEDYYSFAYDDSLGVTLQKWTDKNLAIGGRIVWYAHYGEPDGGGQLVAQIFLYDFNNDGAPVEIGEAAYLDAELGKSYNIVLQHRGNMMLFFVGDQLIRKWQFKKKEYGKVTSSEAYFWAFSYCVDEYSCDIQNETNVPGQPVGTVSDMVVRFKE